ncbi:MAG: peptide-methionine (R)-S-oxide reductase MsrB [Candidatus Saccharibacteria bacterium]
MNDDLKNKPDEYWKEKLTDDQFRVVRKKGTETPWTGVFLDNHESGTYKCVGCGQDLFMSDTKFDSGSGWPSFWDVVDKSKVTINTDDAFGMKREEVECSRCGAHLGHVFPDGPADKGGARYCINSMSLAFDPKKNEAK